MSTRSLLALAAVVLLLLLGGGGAAWFYSPMPVEELDGFTYCTCGYSTVQFDHGRITMLKFLHPGVKSGQQIGTYRVAGNRVELTLLFKGQRHHETVVRDNVGLLNPPAAQFPYRYCALDRRSRKTVLYGAALQLRSKFSEWWSRIEPHVWHAAP